MMLEIRIITTYNTLYIAKENTEPLRSMCNRQMENAHSFLEIHVALHTEIIASKVGRALVDGWRCSAKPTRFRLCAKKRGSRSPPVCGEDAPRSALYRGYGELKP